MPVRGRRSRVLAPVLVLLLLVLLPLFGAGPSRASPAAEGHSPAVAIPGSPHPIAGPVGFPTAHRSGATSHSAPTAPVVQAVEHQIAAGYLNPSEVFLPSNFAASGPVTGGAVSPLLTSIPAPMGLSDIGIGSSGAYSYNTSSFEASLHLSSFSAFSPGYPGFAQAADWTSIQLNTVATPIAFPGASNGTFWIQNVVHFNGTEIQFEDNIWNFSARNAGMGPGTILGGQGTVYQSQFYFAFGALTYNVTYPFTLTLYNNLSTFLIGGVAHDQVYLNYTIADTGPAVSGSYDHVVFNGTATLPPAFEVSGSAYNPFESLYDAEVILGGDGGGSNAVLMALNGTLGLREWNATARAYQNIRSSYDFGPDTGETSLGVAAHYVGATEYLVQGPSMLAGLWNTTNESFAPRAKAGWIDIQVTASPAYAFLFATPSTRFGAPLAQDNFSYVPSSATGVATTELPPLFTGSYVFAAWANGFLAGSINISGNSTPQALALAASSSVVDAPVYLFDSAEAAVYGGEGLPNTGWLASNGTLWLNATTDALAAPFLRLNDFNYATFVLTAFTGVNTSIEVNGFVQAPTTFNYTSYSTSIKLPGWTQGYYFFGGTGGFAVANTPILGNTSLFYSTQNPVQSPASVEFFDTSASSARSLAVSQDAIGVAVVGATGTSISGLTASTGAIGVVATGSNHLTVGPVTASGTDAFSFPTWATDFNNDSHVALSGISASGGALGIEAANLTNWTDAGLTVSSGSTGLEAAYSSEGTVSTISVTGSSALGVWTNSSKIALRGVTVDSSIGIDLLYDHGASASAVTVTGSYLSGFVSTGIDQFTNSSSGNFTTLTASADAIALNASLAEYLNLSGVTATGGAAGATLYNVTHVSAGGLSAANQSVALFWSGGSNGTITGGTLGNTSVGAAIANVTHLSISGIAATESALPPTPYFVNPTTFVLLPMAPVAVDNVTHAFLGNLSSVAYPFGVWANYTNFSDIENVSAWNGGIGVATNLTQDLTIASVFAYGNALGVNVSNASTAFVESSTLEDSAGWGLQILNSTAVTVVGNNFVANNNSSVSGVFSPAHVQAFVNNSTGIAFSTTFGNFWSDHSGAGAYVINATTHDSFPAPAFIFNWLQFDAHGLPAGTAWGVTFRGVSYTSFAPLFFIPQWALPNGRYPYTVNPEPGFRSNPTGGTVVYGSANVTVVITFIANVYTVTFTESGLPSGTSWSMTFNGTIRSNVSAGASGTIGFTTGGGSNAFSIGIIAGYVQTTFVPAHGTILVASNLTEQLNFTEVTYAVTFDQSGLGIGTSWSVTFNSVLQSTMGRSIAFDEPNGSFAYSIATIPGWGQSSIPPSGVLAVNGAGLTENLVFGPTVAITFTETGLANGTNWSVTLDGIVGHSTNTTIVFTLPPGSYAYSVPSVTGLDPSPSSGRVTVGASPVGVSVAFAAPPGSSPISPWIYVGAGVGAAAVVGVAAVLLLRRRRGGPAGDATPERTEPAPPPRPNAPVSRGPPTRRRPRP
jgi:hypothetical protein